MKPTGQKGMTLVELLIAVSIFSMICTAVAALLTTCLQAHARGTARSQIYLDGLRAMERMSQAVRRCTYLTIPNSATPSRNILAFSGEINDDNDFYFDDPLFPRIDEDPGEDMNLDGLAGIGGMDDDGGGLVDEWQKWDDDEDGSLNEDLLDGLDNDGDGNIDEDLFGDTNWDNKPGIAKIDDDGDGQVDETWSWDNDEDGVDGEDPLNETVISRDPAGKLLSLDIPSLGLSRPLAHQVTAFQATFESPRRLLITLTLTDDAGQTVTFAEYVYVRNTQQRTGKRVR